MKLLLLCFGGLAVLVAQQNDRPSHMRPPMPEPPPFAPSWTVHINRTPPEGPINSVVETPRYWAVYGFGSKPVVSLLWGMRDNRIFVDPDVDSKGLYDIVIVPPHELTEKERTELVRAAWEQFLGVRIVKEKRRVEVTVLSAPHGKGPELHELPELKVRPGMGGVSGGGLGGSNRELVGSGVSIDDLCELVERFENTVVVDETHLTGQYSIAVKGDGDFAKMLKEQLGLVQTPGEREIEVLRIEKK